MTERTSFGLRVAALAGLVVAGAVTATAWDGELADPPGAVVVAGVDDDLIDGHEVNPSTCC